MSNDTIHCLLRFLTNLSIYVQDTTSFASHIMFYSGNENGGTERQVGPAETRILFKVPSTEYPQIK